MKYANIIHRNIKRYDIRKKEYENILIQNAIIKKRNHFNVLIKEFDVDTETGEVKEENVIDIEEL